MGVAFSVETAGDSCATAPWVPGPVTQPPPPPMGMGAPWAHHMPGGTCVGVWDRLVEVTGNRQLRR